MPAGRPPKPAKLKLLEGNRGHRPIEPDPEPPAGTLDPPGYLSDAEKLVWKFVAEQLSSMELAYKIDCFILEGFVVNYYRAVQCEQIIRERGVTMTATTKSGTLEMKRPEIDIANTAWKNVKAFATDLCMTMTSRAKISIGGKQVADELEDILSGVA